MTESAYGGRRCPDFSGDFETHVTVSAAGADRRSGDPLARWAERHGVPYTRIVLDRGRTPDQPMLTLRGHGTLPAQHAAANGCVARLRADGFAVVRVKIEAAPWNQDVPRSPREAAALPDGCYFEHHVKLLLADDAEVAAVRDVVGPYGARVSRNARRARGDLGERVHERFVTQRCHGLGRPEAKRRLDRLVAALAAAGFPAVAAEEEFVVYDDNPAVDAGWLDTADAEGAP